MRIVLRILGVAFIACLVFLFAGVLATWEPDRPVEKLAARWATAPSQFVDVAGMQVHLRDEGPRDDPVPIVLLHGTADSLHTWEGWTQALKSQRRVVRFDLPGFGLTGPHPQNDYSIESYTRFVTQVVNAMGIQSFVLAGNSLGGHIAWATAIALPSRVSSLILVDSAGYPQKSVSVPIGFRLARMPIVRDALAYVLPRGMVQSSVRNVYGDPSRVTPELVDRYFEMTLRTGNRIATGQRFAQAVQGDSAVIKTLRLPVLILWGGKDLLIPLENAKLFEADIAASKLVVFDALGHVPQEEDAQATVQEVRKFLSSL